MDKRRWTLFSGASFLVVTTFGALLAPAPVSAATPVATNPIDAARADSEPNAGSDIIVTAQKREESIQKVPVSISVTTQDTMRRQGINTLEQLSQTSPTLRVAYATVDYVGIRGLGSSGNPGFEQSVGTFVDNIYRPRVSMQRSGLFDFERVEVLNGPQSTFFGANVIAGAISITTRKPTDVLSGYATALFDPTSNEYNLEGAVGGPVSDKVLARVSLRASGMDGYVYNGKTGTTEPHNRDVQGRLSLRLKPSDGVTVDLRADYVQRRDRGTTSYELLNCPPAGGTAAGQCLAAINFAGSALDSVLDWRATHGATYNNQDFWETAATVNIDIGDSTLTSTTSYSYEKTDALLDSLGVPQRSAVGTQHVLPLATPERYHQFSQELRVTSPTDGKFAYMFGAYFEDNVLDLENRLGFFFIPLGALIPPAPGITGASPIGSFAVVNQKTRHYSVFGSLDYHIAEGLKLSLGARYSSVSKTAHRTVQTGIWDDNLTIFAPLPATQNAAVAAFIGASLNDFSQTTRLDKRFLPSAILQYQISPDVMTYAKYSRGFKSGGFDSTISGSVFNPEQVDAFEIGLKSSFLNKRGTANIAAFTSAYSDLQETGLILACATCAPVPTTKNAASVRARGIEVASQLQVNDWLHLAASGSYLESVYRDYPNAPCTPLQQSQVGSTCSRNLAGSTRPYAPTWRVNLNADTSIPLSNQLDLRFGAVFFYTSSYVVAANLDPLLRQNGYSKLDLRAALGSPDGRWEASVIVRNVANIATLAWGQSLTSTTTSIQGVAAPPRSVGFQLTTKW